MGWVGGWLDTDNKTISVQLNLTGTETRTELGNNNLKTIFMDCDTIEINLIVRVLAAKRNCVSWF